MRTGPQANWGHPIAYHPLLAKFFGSVNASIFFGQLAYWEPRSANPQLGVYKTAKEWTEETGLSYREQSTARKLLVDAGYLTETHQRLEHRMFFRIEWQIFNCNFYAWVENRGGSFALDGASTEGEVPNDDPAIRGAQTPKSPNDENAIRELRKAQFGNDESAIGGLRNRRSSIGTETTSETTNKAPSRSRRAPAKQGSEFVLPSWIDAQAWADYEDMRGKLRKPMTDKARQLAVRELEKLQAQGFSPRLVLEQSVLNSWQGLFELKGQFLQQNKQQRDSGGDYRDDDPAAWGMGTAAQRAAKAGMPAWNNVEASMGRMPDFDSYKRQIHARLTQQRAA